MESPFFAPKDSLFYTVFTPFFVENDLAKFIKKPK